MSISYNRLWKLMIDRKMMQAELAKKSGVTTQTLSRMKNNNANVSVQVLDKICRALDCKIEDIIEYVKDNAEDE